jgi:hypothetical protein
MSNLGILAPVAPSWGSGPGRPPAAHHPPVQTGHRYGGHISPRRHPPKTVANHYRFPLTKISLYHRMVGLLKVVEYELADRRVVVHFGWPLSSWWDRMAVGVMVFNLMRLPRLFPQFEFDIKYFRRPPAHVEAAARQRRT